jgi:hypothetical protein
LPGRQIGRQHSPLATRSDDIQDRI